MSDGPIDGTGDVVRISDISRPITAIRRVIPDTAATATTGGTGTSGISGTAGTGGAVGAAGAAAARAVFRRALRDMLVLVGVLAVVGVALGALLAPDATKGVWGALIGAAVALVFSGTTVLTMLRTADSSVATTGAVVLGGWLLKMIVLIAVFAVLRDLDFYDRTVLAVVTIVGVLGSVVLDYRAVVTGRVPYVDPGT